MGRLLDKLAIIDLECTCWKGAPPEGEQQEIIEIGLAWVDLRTLEIGERYDVLVKPTMSRISAFCTELTGITAEEVERDGIGYADACKPLSDEIKKKNRYWASWGDFDRKTFVRQSEMTGLPNYPGNNHVNLKAMFPLILGCNELGVGGALNRLGMSFEGNAHRAGDDAYNIARIYCELITRVREGRLDGK